MHFFTKADFCSIGIFSRIARSSHMRIFLASLRCSILSGAVDFMLVACAGVDSQSTQRNRPEITTIERRVSAS
jgi:hypothetical protein